jgi:photosystem II stability/assembly factor-like uncharacterized protein
LYVTGQNGLFVTRDGGRTWTHPITGYMEAPPVVLTGNPCVVYAAGNTTLHRSTDRGQTWDVLYNVNGPFRRREEVIVALHVSPRDANRIVLGTAVDMELIGGSPPDAVHVSIDGGRTWNRHPYDGRARGLIPWDIAEDASGILYIGTEIWDHPEPYRAPYFRSLDGGRTWQDVTGALPWHVVDTQIHPARPTVYALTEGLGVYVSEDAGLNWRRLPAQVGALELLADPRHPGRLYAGGYAGSRTSGAFVSTDDGQTAHRIGLEGLSVSSLALDGESSALYAASYKSGIYKSVVPQQP